ncbi:MAG: glycosyltransferase family 39 protein [Microgenomates group bacterium]
MKPRIKSFILLIAILGIAAVFRFTGLDWDQGNHLHPDERMILMTVEQLNVHQDMNPHFFAYGSFPFYLLKLTGAIGGMFDIRFASYDKIYILGRILSGVFDIGSVCCIYYILRRLTKNKYTVWFGSLWYAISVLPIQLSHFYAVDTLLTFFSMLTLLLILRYHQHQTISNALYIGVACGLALATKISATILCIPIGITLALQWKNSWKQTLTHAACIGGATLYTFFVSEPFAFFDFVSFKQQIIAQQTMTKNAFTFPYTLQYVGKIPYIYELKNILLWGQGILLGTLSIVGIIYATLHTIKEKHFPAILLLSFFWIYTATVGRFAIGFMRYMLPIYPLLTIFAALLIQKCTHTLSRNKSVLIYGICTGIILLWTMTFMTIYTVPNTRVTATAWIKTNIAKGAVIALEHWDDALPIGFASLYAVRELALYETDTNEKWDTVNQVLSETDYIIIASNRLYTPLMKLTNCSRLPKDKCYKTTAMYYHKLFSGSLGFTKVATFENYPTLPFTNMQINDSVADESFTVYDHPKIMIFKKTGVFTPITLEE